MTTRRLNVLGERRAALEMCGYCPKLCRSACPVSDAEASEALIPWGKMSMTWYVARGELEPDRDVARLAWGCTGCHACRERCEHQNPVAATLAAARAMFRDRSLAPPGSEAVLRRVVERRARLAERARALRAPSGEASDVALLVGCGYLAGRGTEASDGVKAARALFGSVHVLDGCCGLPLKEGGERKGALELFEALVASLGGRRLVVMDAGCAAELRDIGAETLVEAAARRASKLGRVALAGTVRWHDPCRLARGLGLTDEPRFVLERALGAPPAEFERHGREVACSGAGALLPFAMPKTARTIVRAKLAEHARLGGGTLVTACATSLGWFRAQRVAALDLATILARSLTGG
jgi:Fe-S oxidoreductase